MHQTMVLRPMMQRFVRTKLASYNTLIMYTNIKITNSTTVILYDFSAKQQKTKSKTFSVKDKYKEGWSCKKVQKKGRVENIRRLLFAPLMRLHFVST